MLTNVSLKVIDPRIGTTVPLPRFQTAGSAGLDLYACLEQALTLEPNACILVPSGISIYIKDPRYCGIIAPRSGLGHKRGIVLGNSVGIIDADYQGEIKISCWNRSQQPQTINPLDRIAQLLFLPAFQPVLSVVDAFEETARGEKGFGSTGYGATQPA